MNSNKTKVKVKWFDNKKGFGFVLTPEGKDAFLHYSAIITAGYKTLRDGQEVECEFVATAKGLRAINVSI